MSNELKGDDNSALNSTSRIAFAVAMCAFTAAGIGAIVNHWLVGWMMVGGMAGIGLFYAVVGLLNLRATSSIEDDRANSNASEKAARLSNLYGEPISPLRAYHSTSKDLNEVREQNRKWDDERKR